MGYNWNIFHSILEIIGVEILIKMRSRITNIVKSLMSRINWKCSTFDSIAVLAGLVCKACL